MRRCCSGGGEAPSQFPPGSASPACLALALPTTIQFLPPPVKCPCGWTKRAMAAGTLLSRIVEHQPEVGDVRVLARVCILRWRHAADVAHDSPGIIPQLGHRLATCIRR